MWVLQQDGLMQKIRILAFSDWRVQNMKDIFDFMIRLNEPVDFILYGGDDVARFKIDNTNIFTLLAERTIQKKVLAVVGNDDDESVKEVLTDKNIIDLHNNPFRFKDFAFMGLEGSTGDMGYILYTEKNAKLHLEKQYKKVKGKKIILVSHTPPYGVLDNGIRFADRKGAGYHHIGSTAVSDFVKQNKISAVVCGHCHLFGGKETELGKTKVINVASHDSSGSKGNFVIIEIDSKGKIQTKWYDTLMGINRNSLMYLHGVGPAKEAELKQIGIKTVKDLANLNPVPENLKKLHIKAKSVIENKSYQINPFSLPKENLIFYDIETDIACERVWLIGVLNKGKFSYFYTDSWGGEKKMLKDFIKFLEANPKSVLVSFSGTNFDKNKVYNALIRQKIDSKLFFNYPHIDLCQLFRQSFIFPNQSYALKNLSAHLGYPLKNPDMDGWRVALAYMEHVNEKKPLDPRVFEYNEDDVKSLPFMIKKITEGLENL